MIKSKAADFSYKYTLGAMLIFISVISTALSGFLFKFPLSPFTLPAAVLILLSISFFKDRRLFKACLLNLFILALFSIACQYIFDWSYDGMYYHKQAVITLKEGWNPLYETAISKDPFAGYPDMSLWLENYPKGLWIFSAAIYSITNLLETGKAVNILFIGAVFSLTFGTVRELYGFTKKKSFLFGLLFSINPVFLGQIFTYYNDLAVGSLFIMSVLLCIRLYAGKADFTLYATLFCISASSLLVKFTAPVLLGIVYIIFGIMCALRHKNNLQWMVKPVLVIISAFFIGLSILGFDPYIEHIMTGQHIIHPAMGKDKYDIMNTNPPKGFNEKLPQECTFISLFSKTSNDIQNEPQLKIPFTVSESELEPMSNADVRIGGFGVFFSGILILSLIQAAVSILNKKKIPPEIAGAFLTILSLALFFPESWWARYASYIYYLPLLLLLYSSEGEKTPLLSKITSAAAVINSCLILYFVLSAGIQETSMLDNKLSKIKDSGCKVLLRVNDFPTHVKLFSEAGIDFEISHEPISPGENIFYRNTKYKFID